MKIQLGTSVFLLFFTFVFVSCARYSPASTLPDPPAIDLSQQLIAVQKAGNSADAIVEQLAELNPNELKAELNSKEKKLAFWVNIYNGMVQHLLSSQPSLWENRGNFFSGDRVTIAGHLMALENIEHGIIRGGEAKLGLGLIPKFFQNKFERSFKIKGGDPRIHFALNCGAIDCPPVEVYEPATVNERLDHRSRLYLQKHTTLSEDGNTVTSTPLFSWFRGDFSSYGGVIGFLRHYDIIPADGKKPSKKYKNYDWTLATNVYAED